MPPWCCFVSVVLAFVDGWGAGMLLYVQPMYRCEQPVLRLHALLHTALERMGERVLFLSLEALHCDGAVLGQMYLAPAPSSNLDRSASCNPRLQARLRYIACTLLTPGPLLYIFHHPCPLLDQVQGCCWSTQVQSKLGALGPHSPGGGLLLYTLLAAGVGMDSVVSCLAVLSHAPVFSHDCACVSPGGGLVGSMR